MGRPWNCNLKPNQIYSACAWRGWLGWLLPVPIAPALWVLCGFSQTEDAPAFSGIQPGTGWPAAMNGTGLSSRFGPLSLGCPRRGGVVYLVLFPTARSAEQFGSMGIME